MNERETELKYYFLEQYFFETVGPKFRATGSLTARDFFSILIWKANRAKSYAAERLKKENVSVEEAVVVLSRRLFGATGRRERFELLVGMYGFQLATASAILSILWPEEFTVYDVRVCESFPGRFDKLAEMSDSAKQWREYERYIDAVNEGVAGELSLRDKDRVLWARSALRQLQDDLKRWDRENSERRQCEALRRASHDLG